MTQNTLQRIPEWFKLKHECSAIKSIKEQIKQVAPTSCTVLVVGETGVGKGFAAYRVFAKSNRTDHPLVHINCATPPETQVEAELFGYHKKPLLGHSEPVLEQLEQLAGGSIIIDEISELSEETQAYFLEVLELIEQAGADREDSTYDVRFIVTSQYDLKRLVEEGKFNKRLYYHLNVFTIFLPPIRNRGEEKIEIATLLLLKLASKHNKNISHFDDKALEFIRQYTWPGNYREMRNTIERAVILASDPIISALHLQLPQQPISESAELSKGSVSRTEGVQEMSLEDYFRHFVLEHQEQMNETELAQKLGISRKCLWERRQKFGIPRKKVSSPTQH